MMSKYSKGDKVAWRSHLDSPMAGTITYIGIGTLYVERVDGGVCVVPASRCKPATPDDIENVISEFIV